MLGKLDDRPHEDFGTLRRRERDEPTMVRPVRILRGPRLAGNTEVRNPCAGARTFGHDSDEGLTQALQRFAIQPELPHPTFRRPLRTIPIRVWAFSPWPMARFSVTALVHPRGPYRRL
jgi:hypothetical protein